MRRRRPWLHHIAVTGVLAAALAMPAPASARRRPAAPPCEGARYLLEGSPLLTGAAAPAADALAVSATQVAIGDACPPVAPRQLRVTKKGATKLKVVWRRCEGLTGKVRLTGQIIDGCARLVATLKARRFTRAIEATRSRCGDGRPDPPSGEQCEPPGTPECDADCRAIPPLTVTTTTTLPARLDVWRPATVPFDPACSRCRELETADALPHLGSELRLLYDPAIDDPIAQWGDCLASMLRCFEVRRGVRSCAAEAACPAECRALFASRAPASADDRALLPVLDGVYVDPGAPCRPVEAGP